MNMERAKQIYQSEQMIDVLYEGVPVWIEELNESGSTAYVTAVQLGEQPKEVPVTELVEEQTNVH